MTYQVFSRTVYRRENGQWIPNPGARRRTIRHVDTIEEARAICAQGPANQALEQGKEYRHLSFYEFTSDC